MASLAVALDMRLAVLVFLGLAALFDPARALAQDRELRTDQASRGRVAFEAGHYREALDHFQRAYEATGSPILLYNIGQAADRMRLDATTLRAFQLYLQRYPDAPNRDEVRHRMEALEPLVDIQAKALAAEHLKANDTQHMTVNVAEMLMPSPYGNGPSSQPVPEPEQPPSHRHHNASVLRSGLFWGVAVVVMVGSVIVVAAMTTGS